jgi:hypothetical protein
MRPRRKKVPELEASFPNKINRKSMRFSPKDLHSLFCTSIKYHLVSLLSPWNSKTAFRSALDGTVEDSRCGGAVSNTSKFCMYGTQSQKQNGLMGFMESGGLMSIRVKGYDFFSKSCQVCEPISHMILLRAPLPYIFCRTVAYFKWLTTDYDASASCEWSMLTTGGRERERVEAVGASKRLSSIDRSLRPIDAFDRLRPIYDCFQLFPAPLKPVLLPLPPVVVEEATVVATGPLQASKELKRQS